MKILTVLWLIISTILSHMPGARSSLESQTLARWTKVDEGRLRRSAHVICFFVLSLLFSLAFPTIPLWLRAAALVGWSVIDEATKPMIPGRHFSWKDVGLNACGSAAGVLVAIFIKGVV